MSCLSGEERNVSDAPNHPVNAASDGYRHPEARGFIGALLHQAPALAMNGVARVGRWLRAKAISSYLVLSIASLVWLVYRSGTQPRRLAYPCQRAASANLGVLAILALPSMTRKSRSIRKRGWGLAVVPGAVAACIVVSVVISRYYGPNLAPGNPALVSWPRLTEQDLAVPDYGLSPRVLAPNGSESVVAINRNDAVTYGSLPYGPGANTVYDLVWKSVADLHLGPWNNPLRDLLRDMNGDGEVTVVLKPNCVAYYDVRTDPPGIGDPEGRSPSYTHPAVARPLVDMAVAAGATKVMIGDGSTDPENDDMQWMGYPELTAWLADEYPDVEIPPYPVNFQQISKFTWVHLDNGPGGESAYAGSPYTSDDLGKAHLYASVEYFGAPDGHGTPGPGVSNCMGYYAVTDYLLDADLMVDLPKVKVHLRTVNTLALKNWVGGTMLCTYDDHNTSGYCRITHAAKGAVPYSYETSFGNDLIWRDIVDLHRILLYWGRGQGMQSTPMRGYLCVTDAVVCGETVINDPTHWRANTILASVDPVAADAVACRIQRYKFDRIPITNNANVASNWAIGTSDPGKLRVVGGPLDDPSLGIGANFDHLSVFDVTYNPQETWPDWDATVVNDITPPTISSASLTDGGDGTWIVEASISSGHVAYFYYGDDGNGAPFVARLGRNGNGYSAIVDTQTTEGTLVAQDEYFNTASAAVSGVVDRPRIDIDITEFVHSVHSGDSPAPDVFTIRNGDVGTLVYNITSDQPWLSVSPSQGESTGEEDPIQLLYDCDSLPGGSHHATVTVSDPHASNNSRHVSISLVVLTCEPYVTNLSTGSVYCTIQAAIDDAGTGDEIVLSPGTYTGSGNRDIDCQGKAITVRGSDPDDPAVVAVTVIDCQGSQSEPHRGFVFRSGEGSGSVLSGVTITHGHGPLESFEGGSYSAGGAIYCTGSGPVIRKCVISDSQSDYWGGGMYCLDSNPVLCGCTFSGNSCTGGTGGAMYNNASQCLIVACRFVGNTAGYGAAMYNYSSSPMVADCLFAANVATWLAGAMRNNAGSAPTLVNCTLSGNSANEGGGLHNSASSPLLTSSILWGNSDAGSSDESAQIHSIGGSPAIRCCCLQGLATFAGNHNTGVNPLLADVDGPDNNPGTWQDNDYHLTSGSACIGAGDNAVLPSDSTDLDGDGNVTEPMPSDLDLDPRVKGCVVDIGVYEFQNPPVGTVQADLDHDCDVDSTDYALYESCASGPGIPAYTGCEETDLDFDNDVDQADFALLQRCFSGENVPAELACM